MAPLVPVAADVVLKVLQGRLKVPASVRASTALRVVELHVGQAGKGGGDPDELPMLAKLAQALGARAPRQPVTVEAVPVEVDPVAKA